jgi:hypothetical protein
VVAERRSAARRLEQGVRRQAREQASREQAAREGASARQVAAKRSRASARRSSAREPFAAWLDGHDSRTPLTRADQYSQGDRDGAAAVAAGGGFQAVIEATGLRTLDNVVRLIDQAILKQALDNDVLRNAHPPGW